MNKKIVKNFDFLNKESDYYESDKLMFFKNKLINEIIENEIINRKNYKYAGMEVNSWIMSFLRGFNEIELGQRERNLDGNEFIHAFTDKLIEGGWNSAKIRNSLLNINRIRNEFAHNHERYINDEENEKLQILWQLRNLHLALKLILKINDREPFKWEDKNNKEKEIDFLDANTNKTIDVSKQNILSIFSGNKKKFKIPIYQRSYNWKEQNVDNLLRDIQKRNEDSQDHYFGTIAWKEFESKDGIYEYKIIDGQQRLTTSFLIIIAYLDLMKNNFGKTDFENETIFPIKESINEEYQELFINPGANYEANMEFKSICEFKIDELNNRKNSTYLKNYLQIKEYLLEKYSTELEITTFINCFIEKFSCSIITFENLENKKELEIFDNLNSKGMTLSFSDLIKNKILNFCSEKLLSENENKLIQEYNSFAAKLDNDSDKLDDFFKALISYSTGHETSKNQHKNLESMEFVYHDLLNIPKLGNIEQTDEFISLITKKLSNYAEIYRDFLSATGARKINPHYGILSNLDTHHFFKYLNRDKSFLFVNLYFFLFDFYLIKKINLLDHNIKIPRNDLKEILDINFIFTKAIAKHFVLEGQGDSSFGRNIFKLINELRKNNINNNSDIKKIKTETIELFTIQCKLNSERKEEFKENLNSLKKDGWIAKTLLKLCEWTYSEINKTGSNLNWNDNEDTLEHIIPQTPNSEYKKEFDDVNFDENLEKYKNSLGNYLMLSQRMNASESNNNFLSKKVNYEKKCNSPFLYRNQENSTIGIANKNQFKFDEVISRTKEISNYIIKEVYKEFY